MTVKFGKHIYVMEIKVVDALEIDQNPAYESLRIGNKEDFHINYT